MKLTNLFLGALASVVTGHADTRRAHAGVPQIVGGRKFLSELKARAAVPDVFAVPIANIKKRSSGSGHALEERQNNDGQCGAGIGSCTSNCCSSAGWCGTGTEYCAAPDCQFQYGPGCDANKVPAGASTAGIARPLLGSVPYGGAGIYDCAVPGDVAFTFDDGPYSYTSDLLDKMKVYNAKGTFFITGNNLGKGPIDSTAQWSSLIKRMVAEGHQVASHSWSHQDLSTLDTATFDKQIIYNAMAFRNILGYFPTYMRPPYSSCNAACEARLKTLGYHITYFDLDTAGYLNTLPTTIQNSKNIWDAAISNSNPAVDTFLEIEHDIHNQVVNNLTDYILASMYKKGYKSVTVGDCLRDPVANWYRSGSGGGGTTPPAVSTDGSCSASITCLGSSFGNCCSQYGYCGSTDTYCGAGCQPVGGTCAGSTSSVEPTSSIKPPTSTAKPTTVSTIKTTSLTSSKPTSSSSPQTVSTDGSCGTTITCQGSTFGNCCSQYGYCGRKLWGDFLNSTLFYGKHCLAINNGGRDPLATPFRTTDYCGTGCKPGSGTCSSRGSSSSLKPSTSTKPLSTSSKAPIFSTKATTSSTKSSTKVSSSSTKSATPSASPLVKSPDGTCGGTKKYTCLASGYGNCCSQYNWCGATADHCGTACQKGFGTCT
ncbi:hypothetical protein VTL71DRAFT_16464 [Oculimacula yallundae]|uniref:Chitin deacetylase n=1 Tax=Oculimacula yallundae TaxID=86028 RepID=A0ABR4CEI0_9HELO